MNACTAIGYGGEVITLNGPLEAKGQVRLDGRRYALDVFAGGDDTLNAELTNALALLAEPEPEGTDAPATSRPPVPPRDEMKMSSLMSSANGSISELVSTTA